MIRMATCNGCKTIMEEDQCRLLWWASNASTMVSIMAPMSTRTSSFWETSRWAKSTTSKNPRTTSSKVGSPPELTTCRCLSKTCRVTSEEAWILNTEPTTTGAKTFTITVTYLLITKFKTKITKWGTNRWTTWGRCSCPAKWTKVTQVRTREATRHQIKT